MQHIGKLLRSWQKSKKINIDILKIKEREKEKNPNERAQVPQRLVGELCSCRNCEGTRRLHLRQAVQPTGE